MAELTGFDSLTVFQSAPLVWIDENQGKHTLESPNFVAEAKDILESVREGASRIDAEIDVIFEPANIERLSAFLGDTNQSPVMHFSGHGHPEFLGLEHEGALQPLKTEELRELVATGTGDLKVVFVAACYSQMAGEAFVKAGVKHVVCCQQNEELRDSAAIVFARHFYRALANGNKLERSFEHARQVVRVSPDIIDSSREMEKFILLPENQDHDVDVFYTSPKQRVTHTLMPRNLPPAPRILLCRELYVFCLIEKLKFASLVSVTGPIGIGRSSVAKATCNYLFERSRTFDTFYWVSTDHCYSNNCVSQKLQQAYQDIREEQFNDISNYRIVEIILKKARALIVIDARDFSSSSMGQLQLFLDHLILETNFTKVIILCPPDITIQMDRHFTEQLVLPPLDFKSTVLLFGLNFPLVRGKCLYGVRTPKDLAALLVPAEKEAELPNSKCLSRRRSRIFDRVGRGIPGEILLAAKRTTEKDYLELLRIGRKTDYEPSFNTRSELEVEIARISSLMILAEEELDFLVAQDFREKLEELRFLRNSLYTLAELKAIVSKLLRERSAAVEFQDYITAAALHKQLEDLQDKMQAEKEASLRVTIPCPRDTVKTVAIETRKQPATVMDAGGHKQVEATPDKELSEIPIAGAEKAVVAPDIEDGDELTSNRSTEVGTKSHSTPLSGHMPAMLKDSLSSSPPSEDSTSFTSNGLDGFVGVEFTGANKDYDADWNTQIIRSKTQLEANLSKLLRYGSVTYGDCSLKVVSIEHNGIARAVARLDCEIELHDDLRPRDYERVKDICHKIAFLLKSAGASETDLNQLMIGTAWIGSLELLIEGPSSVVNLLFSQLRKNGMKLEIEANHVYLVGLAPAMLVRGPYFLRASFQRNELRPDILLLKEGDYRLLCPTSVVARNNIIAKGTGHSFWEDDVSPTLQPLPTVRLLQACSYDFLPLSVQRLTGKANESHERIVDPTNKEKMGKSEASPGLVVDLLVKKKDIFSLICMLRSRDTKPAASRTSSHKRTSSESLTQVSLGSSHEDERKPPPGILNRSQMQDAAEFAQQLRDLSEQKDLNESDLMNALVMCRSEQSKVLSAADRASGSPQVNMEWLIEAFQVKESLLHAIHLAESRMQHSSTASRRNQRGERSPVLVTNKPSVRPRTQPGVVHVSSPTKKEKTGKREASPSLVVELLVKKKDIFSLICMLRSHDIKRYYSAIALMRFARKAEQEQDAESSRLRNELSSTGGMHSLLNVFRFEGATRDLRIVTALAVAYLLPSAVHSSSLLSPNMGLKILECLRFLISADNEVLLKDEVIHPSDMYEAAAMGATTLWSYALFPLLDRDLPPVDAREIDCSRLQERRLARRVRSRALEGNSSAPSLDLKLEALELQVLLERTVSLIVSVAKLKVDAPSKLSLRYALVEQMCAVDAARPIAVREGLLKTLVVWMKSNDVEQMSCAATSVQHLTSTKDKYMAGWIHSQIVNEGALSEIAMLSAAESAGHDVRLAVAEILSCMCVAPHTRSAVVEAKCTNILIFLLYGHGDPLSQQVALSAGNALLQLLNGSVARASVYSTDDLVSGIQDRNDTVISDIVDGGAIGPFVEMAKSENSDLRILSIEILHLLSQDVNMTRQTRLRLCAEGACDALASILKSCISVVPRVRGQEAPAEGRDFHAITELHKVLCTLSNILGATTQNSTVLPASVRDTVLPASVHDPHTTLARACIEIASSGSLESLLSLAQIPLEISSEFSDSNVGIQTKIAFESCRSLALLSGLLLSETAVAEGYVSWTLDVLFALTDMWRRCLSCRDDERDGSDIVFEHEFDVLRGIVALSKYEPLKIIVVEQSLPDHLKALVRHDQNHLISAMADEVMSLSLGCGVVDPVRVAGNDPKLLATWFCLQRSLVFQAMAREEICMWLTEVWSPAAKEARAHNRRMEAVQVADQHAVESIFDDIFDNIASDIETDELRETLIRQYHDIFEHEDVHKVDSNLTKHDPTYHRTDRETLLSCHVYPLNQTINERQWILSHRHFLYRDDQERSSSIAIGHPFTGHVKELLDWLMPSNILQHDILPVFSFQPAATFNFRALPMPKGHYHSFQREGQLISQLYDLDKAAQDPSTVFWTLAFTDSTFAGDFSEFLIQLLYRCPAIKGLSFRNTTLQSALTQVEQNDGGEEGVNLLANLAGSLPPEVTSLAYDNVLSDQAVRALVTLFQETDKLWEGHGKDVSEGDSSMTSSDTDQKKRTFRVFALRNSPGLSRDSWTSFFSLLGTATAPVWPLRTAQLACLQVLDLRGNNLGDDMCAAVLRIAHDHSSGCCLEQLDLSGNAIGKGVSVAKELWSYVTRYRYNHRAGVKTSRKSWKSPLETLNLASNDLHEGSLAIEISAMLKHNTLTLVSLDLSDNGVGRDSYQLAEVLSGSLVKNTCIRQLNLSRNCFDPHFVNTILDHLRRSLTDSNLIFLRIEENSPALNKAQQNALDEFLHRTRTTALERHFTEQQQRLSGITVIDEAEDEASVAKQNSALAAMDYPTAVLPEAVKEVARRDSDSFISAGKNTIKENSPALNKAQQNALERFMRRSLPTAMQRHFTERQQRLSGIAVIDEAEEEASVERKNSALAALDCPTAMLPEAVKEVARHDSDTFISAGKNMITVLFSAPLVYHDEHKTLRPFAKLDFELERELLWQCLKEASRDIELSFDNATLDRLQAAMTKRCSCLHYSGHGHQDYLTLENGSGGPHWLEVKQLTDLMVPRGGAPFQFVFVSACHSGIAGETFARAGVPHVVCCQQQSEPNNTAALAFTQQFYLALAVGHTVKDSFDRGCKAVRAIPTIRDAKEEMKKFVLLPRDGNHNVPIFHAKPVPSWPRRLSFASRPLPRSKSRRGKLVRSRSTYLGSARNSELSVRNMMQENPSPDPPQWYTGREIDVYNVLKLILNNRLVNVVGENGIGRSSMVCALCHYINERRNTISKIHRIFFVRLRQVRGGRYTSYTALLRQLHDKVVEDRNLPRLEGEMNVEIMFDSICRCLQNVNGLIVFDGVDLLDGGDELQDFVMFLKAFFHETNTRLVRVLITARKSLDWSSIGGIVECTYRLGPLDFASTVRLFANLCPDLTPLERKSVLTRVVLDTEQADMRPSDSGVSNRTRELFRQLGAGIPSRIEKAAFDMSKEDVLHLGTGAP